VRPKIEPTFGAAALQLDGALQLLQQSGHALPDRARSEDAWLQAVIDGLCELSSRDALTGLANRRHFELTLASEVDRVARAGEPALVLMIDIDHFKRVNDAHGHQSGDLVLRAIAVALSECVRPMDTVARFGGEEFVAVLPSAGDVDALIIAERLRSRVADLRVSAIVDSVELIDPAEDDWLAVSIGVSCAPVDGVELSDLLHAADGALYRAKAAGRNRVLLAERGTGPARDRLPQA
jgi:diguanylate cyclase (GGDEF)-like protein